MKLTGIGRLLH